MNKNLIKHVGKTKLTVNVNSTQNSKKYKNKKLSLKHINNNFFYKNN